MASIRELKKDINVLTYDLLTKCYVLKEYESGILNEQFDEVISKIVLLRNDLILRTNHPETDAESRNLKAHYRKIKEDLFKFTGIIEELKSQKD